MSKNDTFFSVLMGINTFEKLKEFEALVMNLKINVDAQNRLLRQATKIYCDACPII